MVQDTHGIYMGSPAPTICQNNGELRGQGFYKIHDVIEQNTTETHKKMESVFLESIPLYASLKYWSSLCVAIQILLVY